MRKCRWRECILSSTSSGAQLVHRPSARSCSLHQVYTRSSVVQLVSNRSRDYFLRIDMILPVPLQYKGVKGSIPTPSEYSGDTRWSSAREIFRGKPLSVALYALAAAGFVGWSSGWLSSPTKVSGPEASSAAYQQSLQKLSRVLRPHTELSAAWLPGRKRPSSGAVTPFSTFTCFGDENAVDIIYSKPFRFHVYSDMPSSMYNNTVFRAVRFWEPNHR